MILHKLLKKQLGRLELSESTFPPNLEKWQKLLERINITYTENEQERYLVNRSTEISSREIQELNNKLQASQEIAKLGYWYINIKTNKNVWSKSVYKMLGFDITKDTPDINSFLSLIHPEDRNKLQALIKSAFDSGKKYEIEVRIKKENGTNDENEYDWYLIIGQPVLRENYEIEELASILMDITQRKKSEIEVQNLHQQLMTSARRVGMADAATSILHNVGNILNSANVSLSLVTDYMTLPYFEKLYFLGKMLQENSNDLPKFLTEDEKGKLIPDYIVNVTESMKMKQDAVLTEIKNLDEHLKHIKEITVLQKSLSGVQKLPEEIFMPDLIETAIKMCDHGFSSKKLQLNKKFFDEPYIISDRAKVLQILVNLLQNAKEAMKNNEDGLLVITLIKLSSDKIEIQIKDNGIGISKENLTKIFSLGFTTKETGHGFGLHSSAIAAQELQGTLQVLSDGPQKGATFILTLPINIEGAKHAKA